MQGYILNINRVRDEDLIVSILTQNRLKTLYRFYGARHSNINIGYKIDFEAITSLKSNIAMLRDVHHLGFRWLSIREKAFIWQQFCNLLFAHLRDIEILDEFYFNLLDNITLKLDKQNAIRIAVDSYIKLLLHEGRLQEKFECFLCDGILKNEVVVARALHFACKTCIPSKTIDKNKLETLICEKSTIYLNDDEVEYLWKIMLEGF